MWQPLYLNTPEEDVPVGHITNGVHVESWVAPQMHLLFDRHLGTHWPRDQRLPETWEGIETVEDAELWETHQVLKARLINFVRTRLAPRPRPRDGPVSPSAQAIHAPDPITLASALVRRF